MRCGSSPAPPTDRPRSPQHLFSCQAHVCQFVFLFVCLFLTFIFFLLFCLRQRDALFRVPIHSLVNHSSFPVGRSVSPPSCFERFPTESHVRRRNARHPTDFHRVVFFFLPHDKKWQVHRHLGLSVLWTETFKLGAKKTPTPANFLLR